MFEGPIVHKPNFAGTDCAGLDSVGPDYAGSDRTCTHIVQRKWIAIDV